MRNVIYVLSNQGRWRIECDHCKKAWVDDDKDKAISFARRHVSELPPGTLSQIKVQRSDGTWQTEWTYGEDPFPPRG